MKKMFLSEYKNLLNEFDYSKNSFSPEKIRIGSNKNVWWKCKKGHEWEAPVVKRNAGRGCPYCSNRKVLIGYNDLATTNPELLAEWNYEKNDLNNINPKNITSGTHIKVWWKCNKGHEWLATPRVRIIGCKCPYCTGKSVLSGFNDLATTHPSVLKEWDYDKNNEIGIMPQNVSYGSEKKVYWICKRNHSYIKAINMKVKGIGCPYCANKLPLKGYNDFETLHPLLMKEWDYDENNKKEIYPDRIVRGGKKKISWICDKGHKWEQTISSRITNKHTYHRCPVCTNIYESSIPEKILYFYLKNIYPDAINNYKSSWLGKSELDIYLPSLKVGIEYDGSFYHNDMKYDMKKDNICKKNGIKLIRIREKGCPKIKTSSIVYTLKEDYCQDWRFIESALDFLGKFLKADLNYNIRRDYEKILSMVTFLEKENCIYNTNPELLKEWDYEKNDKIGINPHNISAHSAIKVWWICKSNHSYSSTIYNRIYGNYCPYCKNKTVLTGFNDFFTNYPELVKEWDYEKNNVLGIYPDKVLPKVNKKVWWKCSNNHSYEASINNRTLKKSGCPYCSNKKVLSGYNDVATTHPYILDEWDYQKNAKYGIFPEKISYGSEQDAWWICKNGHSYLMNIHRRAIRNYNCPYCSGEKVLEGYNDLATTNKYLLKEWDYKKNKGLDVSPQTVSKGSGKKVWWTCSKNHSYIASVVSRVRGTNCPYCSGQKVLVGYNDIASKYPELLEEWNYNKNNMNCIFPEKISKSYSKKVWWICKEGHEWQAYVYNKLNGYGKCPYCKNKKHKHTV